MARASLGHGQDRVVQQFGAVDGADPAAGGKSGKDVRAWNAGRGNALRVG